MSIAKDPNRPEFYVYHLCAEGIPFYVGIGRSARASDRIRYIRYLLTREAQGKLARWSLSGRAIAALLRAGCDVQVTYPASDLTRGEALARERSEITRLLSSGFVLANIQYNPQRPKTHEPVVESVLVRCGKLAPNNSFKPMPFRGTA